MRLFFCFTTFYGFVAAGGNAFFFVAFYAGSLYADHKKTASSTFDKNIQVGAFLEFLSAFCHAGHGCTEMDTEEESQPV